jgi:hypothetical protein
MGNFNKTIRYQGNGELQNSKGGIANVDYNLLSVQEVQKFQGIGDKNVHFIPGRTTITGTITPVVFEDDPNLTLKTQEGPVFKITYVKISGNTGHVVAIPK